MGVREFFALFINSNLWETAVNFLWELIFIGGKMKRLWLFVLSVLFFCVSLYGCLNLLGSGKLSGAEFSALAIASSVLSLVLAFMPEVQEVSVAGNVVKMREVKAKAEETIASLEAARSEMFRVMLTLIMKPAGGWHDMKNVDPRVDEFWRFIEMLRRYKCFSDHEKQLRDSVKILLAEQVNRMFFNGSLASDQKPSEILRPAVLVPLITQASLVDPVDVDGVTRYITPDVEESLEAYIALHAFYESVNK